MKGAEAQGKGQTNTICFRLKSIAQLRYERTTTLYETRLKSEEPVDAVIPHWKKKDSGGPYTVHHPLTPQCK